MAKQKKVVDIPEDQLKSLFDRCDGRRSHYLILTEESDESLALLVDNGWIKHLTNSGKRPWYTATDKLITKFRSLEDHEQKQLSHQAALEEMEKAEIEAEEARAKEAIKQRESVNLGKKESKGNPIKAKPVEVDGHIYASVAACARAEGLSKNEVRERLKSEDYYEWNYYEEK